ncbi:MAG TPA: phasin family protein [Usitatibacter sp.]|nr:phasin family protein [Usitatibacter sp.]
MASRTRKSRSSSGAASGSGNDPAQAVRDSAQKIWLAGLGAFERAKTDGPRMFETLVEQGRKMGARAVGAADDALKTMRETSYSGGRWDKLEQVFEDRVSRSLNRLGVITNREVEELSRQVQELNETVRGLMAGKAPGGPPRAGAGAKKKTKKKKASAPGKRKAKRATPG